MRKDDNKIQKLLNDNALKKLETQYIWIEAANTQCVETKAHFTETETRLFDRRGILCVVS